MGEKIARFVIKHRLIIFLLIVISTLYFLVFEIIRKGIPMHHEATDLRPKGHPYVELNEHMEEYFGAYTPVIIGMRVKEGDLFTQENIFRIFRIQRKLQEMRGVVEHKIISITSKKLKLFYKEWHPSGEPVLVIDSARQIVADKMIHEGKIDEYMPFYKKLLINDPKIYGTYVSRDLKSTIIQAAFRWERDYRHIFESIRKILEEEKTPTWNTIWPGTPSPWAGWIVIDR